jgi:hypothetical protein
MMPKGTVQVSFAGTIDEARAFAAEHNINASNRLSKAGSDGLPMLSLPFANFAQLTEVRTKLAALGWDIEFQETRMHYRSRNCQ